LKIFSNILPSYFTAGYVSTQYAWQTGKVYTYEVRGRLMTGISKINTQYAGLEIEYQVELTAIGPQTVVLNVSFLKFKEKSASRDNILLEFV